MELAVTIPQVSFLSSLYVFVSAEGDYQSATRGRIRLDKTWYISFNAHWVIVNSLALIYEINLSPLSETKEAE
jgi:hypothetical protein